MAQRVPSDLYARACGRDVKIDHEGVARVVYFYIETGSECGQIRCYTRRHTLIVCYYTRASPTSASVIFVHIGARDTAFHLAVLGLLSCALPKLLAMRAPLSCYAPCDLFMVAARPAHEWYNTVVPL